VSSATSTPASGPSLAATATQTSAATSTVLTLSYSTSTESSPSTATSTPSSTTQAAPPPPPEPTAYPTCGQTVINVPGSYPSIQAAIDAAAIGDTVNIAAGTYAENVNLKSGICLQGAGVDQTVIWKAGAPGITGSGVSYVIIQDLTVKDSGCAPGSCGGGGDGGGVHLTGSSNITLESCRLTGNVAVNGGGILASGSSVTLDHCLIDGNTATNIGAGLVAESNSTVRLTNVTMPNNVWSNALGNGGVGGIRSLGSNVQVSNSIIWGNNSQNLAGDGLNVTNSDVTGWSGGSNNISSNPNFVSATDYHLQTGSPSAGMGLY
jgi:hypothetical protein